MRICKLLAASILLSSISVAAQDEPADLMAEQQSRKPSMDSLPVTIAPAVLTVAGESYWHQEHYNSGEVPTVSAYDKEGNLLPDGTYEYELKSLPDDTDASDFLAGDTQSLLTRNTQKPAQVLSGKFKISGSKIISQ